MVFPRLYSPDLSTVFFCVLTYEFYKIAFHIIFQINISKEMFEWFEVRSLVLLKIQVFRNVTPCQLVNEYRLESPKKWLWKCCNDLNDV